MCISCGRNTKSSQVAFGNDTAKIVPSRQPYEGFEWKEISGAGLKLMTQSNDDIRLLVDPLLPGVSDGKEW